MSDSLNALDTSGRGGVLSAIAHPSVINPLGAMNAGIEAAGHVVGLKRAQFAYQQEQLGPAYQAMRMLMATNPNASSDDVMAALSQSTRVGGNVDGLVQNFSDWMTRGGKDAKPSDWVRATALGGMAPENQALMSAQKPGLQDTGEGVWYGTVGGPLSAAPGKFTPNTFIAKGLTPEQMNAPITIPDPSGVGPPQTMSTSEAIRRGLWAPPGGMGAGGGGGGGGAPGTSAGAAVNNFGNIKSPSGGFASYATPQDGVAAMAQNLTAYQDQHGINTLNGITARWAPVGDGANNPAAYARTLSQLTGLDPDAKLDLHDPATLAKIIPAMAQVEHGRPMAVGGDVLTAGISSGLSGRPVGSGGQTPAPYQVASNAPQGPPSSPAAQPAGGGAGGINYIPASPGGGGGGGAYRAPAGPYGQGGGVIVGQAPGTAEVVKGAVQRQQDMEQQVAKAVNTRATLEGMEAELNNMPTSGVAAGPIATIKNLIVSSGFASQQTVDEQSKGLSAQEQFEKFSSLLNQQLLTSMGGQATDARQELTGAATPSSLHSKLGNLGIIHMLEGNITALQVMARSYRQAQASGQAFPGGFDAWRDNFTSPNKDGARFDPRVFWIASMNPAEQQSFVSSLTGKDRERLLRNSNYAEQQGWVRENPDHSMGNVY
jgi:hypothetical protein